MADIDYEEFYQFIKPMIKDKITLLDAGCGSGYLTTLFAKDFEVTGIDIDEDMLMLARKKIEDKHLNARFYHHDLNDELSNKYDVIVALFDVLNYFEHSLPIIFNLLNSLNDEGLLIFDVYKEEILDVYHDFIESEDSPIPYTWSIKVNDHIITHKIYSQGETDEVIQYVKPLNYYIDYIKTLGYHIEVTDGPDERKNYFIISKVKV